MGMAKGGIWKFIPSGNWFYVEKKGSKYYMSLKVIGPRDADRIIRGEDPPPRADREILSISAFEPISEESFNSF
jgi:hypothetical protein